MRSRLTLKRPFIVTMAEKALRLAVAKTIKEHRQKKLPIVVWRDGKVVKVPA